MNLTPAGVSDFIARGFNPGTKPIIYDKPQRGVRFHNPGFHPWARLIIYDITPLGVTENMAKPIFGHAYGIKL